MIWEGILYVSSQEGTSFFFVVALRPFNGGPCFLKPVHSKAICFTIQFGNSFTGMSLACMAVR